MDDLSQYSLLCFDFDGLLVDTETLHFQAYEEMLRDMGYDLGLSYSAFIKLSHDSTGSALKRYVLHSFPIQEDWEVLRKRKMKIYTRMLHEGRIEFMPNVEAFLSYATKNFLTCVVTNSFEGDTHLIRSHLPALHQIPIWFTRETYNLPKPHPDGYLAALRHFNIPKEKAIGFEDTLKGVAALKAAQIRPILICCPSHPQLSSPLDITHLPCFPLSFP